MVNFVLVNAPKNAIITKPRKVLAVAWSADKGMVAALRNDDGRTLTKLSSNNQMDLATLIRVSAQRGGIYAR